MALPIVVLVDDDPAILRVLVRTLRNAAVEVRETGSPSDALAIVQREPVAVLVYDQSMPEMNGSELAARVRSISPATKLVLSTGASPGNACENFRVVDKPWRASEMLAAIAAAIAA